MSSKLELLLYKSHTDSRYTLAHFIISCSPASIQRRIFSQSKYEGALPSIHIRLICSIRQSMSMQLLSVELSIPMTMVISIKKSRLTIAPIQLPTMTLFISIFSNDDIYHNILSLLHPYNMDIQALQNHLDHRDLQLYCRILDYHT